LGKIVSNTDSLKCNFVGDPGGISYLYVFANDGGQPFIVALI
jgi:hypothetical protein